LTGGDPLFGDVRKGYIKPDPDEVARRKPAVFLGFSEPEYPVNFRQLLHKRGWDRSFKPALIESSVARGRNIIHDGPSLLETAAWLQEKLFDIECTE
jgi:hypothetical protein